MNLRNKAKALTKATKVVLVFKWVAASLVWTLITWGSMVRKYTQSTLDNSVQLQYYWMDTVLASKLMHARHHSRYGFCIHIELLHNGLYNNL